MPHSGSVGVSATFGVVAMVSVAVRGAKVPLPACVASSVTIPLPVNVRVLPETCAGPDTTVFLSPASHLWG